MNERIALLLVLAAMLSGCVSNGKDATPPNQETAASAAPSAALPGQYAAKAAEVPDGQSIIFDYGGQKAILLNSGGKYYAYLNKCSLEGCKLEYVDGKLRCPCCKTVFDPASGQPVSGPARDHLEKKLVVIVSGEDLYVR